MAISLATSRTLREWEEAGISLANALNGYLGLCGTIEANSLKEGTCPKDLGSHIESKLETLHATLDRQTAQARSVLTKIRNRALSSTSYLPEEVLTAIFTHVIFSYRDSDKVVPMEQSVIMMHRSLCTLASVCSVWRSMVLAQGAFWSVVPVLGSLPAKITGLSIERSGSRDLYLAIAASSKTKFNVADLQPEEHGARLRIINLVGESRHSVTHVVGVLMESSPPIQPSELSILCEEESAIIYTGPPTENDYIYPLDSEIVPWNLSKFCNVLESLSVLRLSSAHIHLDMLTFSIRLTELRLQRLNFGFDRTMRSHLSHALASAAGLQRLEIISIWSFVDPDEQSNMTENQEISLPQLQALLLQDLHHNTLTVLLNSVTSSSHRLTLYLTDKCLMNHLGDDRFGDVEFEDMDEPLKQASIHTLCVDWGFSNSWLSASRLRRLLTLMPELETFQSHGGDLNEPYWDALKRPQFYEPAESTFPHFANLHFSEIGIWVTEKETRALKSMVVSHSGSLRRMVLGGYVWNGDSLFPDDLREEEVIVSWLRGNVQDFNLTGSDYKPLEFQQAQWRLW